MNPHTFNLTFAVVILVSLIIGGFVIPWYESRGKNDVDKN